MNKPECSSSDSLLGFALGRLDAEEASRIIQHLADCTDCSRVIESLSLFESPSQLDSIPPEEAIETDIQAPEISATTAGLTDGHVLVSSLESGDQVSRYQLTRLHASGGMGRVWLAKDGSIGREVALKELLPQQADAPQVWARFIHEAKVTGQLEHPGIVPVYEVNAGDGEKPFYTMRFVRGQTLHSAAREFRKQRESGNATSRRIRELVTALIGVSNAIAYAHSRAVLHRDLKGRNIVLGDFGEVIVLDWGLAGTIGGTPEDEDSWIANSTDVRQTQAGQVLGTPGFMAPEQAAGDPTMMSVRTDVYGLGGRSVRDPDGRTTDPGGVIRRDPSQSPA